MLDGETHGDGRTKRFAEIHDPRRIDILPAEQIRARRSRVGGETFLGWCAGIAAVAAVVREQHVHAMALKRSRERGSIAAVAGVAAEDDDGRTRRRSGSGDEPGAKAQAIPRGERDRLEARETSVVE